jgi:hypothetical protein
VWSVSPLHLLKTESIGKLAHCAWKSEKCSFSEDRTARFSSLTFHGPQGMFASHRTEALWPRLSR